MNGKKVKKNRDGNKKLAKVLQLLVYIIIDLFKEYFYKYINLMGTSMSVTKPQVKKDDKKNNSNSYLKTNKAK